MLKTLALWSRMEELELRKVWVVPRTGISDSRAPAKITRARTNSSKFTRQSKLLPFVPKLTLGLWPFRAELLDGLTLPLDGGRRQVQEVGDFHQLHVGVLARVDLRGQR